ncbi:MAG: hypothetical protein K6G50_10450 [bacterium]|nr:hypothetical protein [bacterium]
MNWNDSRNMLKSIKISYQYSVLYPNKCTECGSNTLHLYMHRFDLSDHDGGIWFWCSHCYNFTHFHGILPSWWKNPDFIDDGRLIGDNPEYLEALAVSIDKWINGLEKASAFERVPRQSDVVRLACDFGNIEAGTEGVVVEDHGGLCFDVNIFDKERGSVTIKKIPADSLELVIPV